MTQQTQNGNGPKIPNSPLDDLGEYARGEYLKVEKQLDVIESTTLLAKLLHIKDEHLGNLENAAIDMIVAQFKPDPYVPYSGTQ